jgi:hypothetical protein
MSASDSALNWEKNITETYEVLKIAYGEQTVERLLVLSGFPSPRVVCLLLKLPEP